MTPKIRNIIIFVGIALVLVLAYFFFFRSSSSSTPALTATDSSTSATDATDATADSTTDANSTIAQNFLTLLLSVKGITLDDSIFDTPAYNSLQDSTIVLTPDGTQGRPNPFAPIGTEAAAANPPATSAPGVTTSDGSTLLAPSQIDSTIPPAKTPAKTTTSKTTTTKTTSKTGTTTK